MFVSNPEVGDNKVSTGIIGPRISSRMERGILINGRDFLFFRFPISFRLGEVNFSENLLILNEITR